MVYVKIDQLQITKQLAAAMFDLENTYDQALPFCAQNTFSGISKTVNLG